MTLKALKEVTVGGIDYVPGETFETLPEHAIDLIRLGYAEEVIPAPDAPAEPPADPPGGSTAP